MSKALKVVEQAGVPAVVDQLLEEYAGVGISTAAEDNAMPLVYTLQALSPAVNERNAAYIKGARPGDFWFRNNADPLVKGIDGFEFQPVLFEKDFVEWGPRDSGGGLKARHKTMPSDAKEVIDAKGRNSFVRPNGNLVVETRYHIGIARRNGVLSPCVLPFSSTGLSVSKNWMTNMRGRFSASGKPLPSLAHIYRLTTKERSNAAGTWFVVSPEYLRAADEQAIREGIDLHRAFASGAKTYDKEEVETHSTEEVPF